MPNRDKYGTFQLVIVVNGVRPSCPGQWTKGDLAETEMANITEMLAGEGYSVDLMSSDISYDTEGV